MLTEETNREDNTVRTTPEADVANEEIPPEEPGKGTWREAFRTAFDRARRQQKPESRRELGRDKSKSLFLLMGVCVAVLLLFFGVFSTRSKRSRFPARTRAARPAWDAKLHRGRRTSIPASGDPDAKCGCTFY